MKKKKVLEIYNDVEKLKVYYPEAFEQELEVGSWYKFISGTLGFYTGENLKSYGIHFDGKEWMDNCTWFSSSNINKIHKKATQQEIATALIKEAEKRGYKKGITYKFGLAQDIRTITSDVFYYSKIDGSLWLGYDIIFINGTWAEIIPAKQMTKEEIEKELGYKIEIV